MFQNTLFQLHLLQYLFIPLKQLDGIPPLLLLRHIVYRSLFDMCKRVLHRPAKGMHGNGLFVPGRMDSRFRRLHNACALQRGNFQHLAPQRPGQLRCIDLIAVLFHHVHHVDSHNHWNTQLHKLRGQVQVSLQICAVYNIQDPVWALAHQVIPGHHLFQRIRGKGINTGKVRDNNPFMLFQPALFLFYRNSRPIPHKLVGAGQRIEQCCLTAVWISCKCNSQIHLSFLTFPFIWAGYSPSTSTISASAFLMESS